MPLYEYECKKCGSVFEVLQKVSDTALTVHEHCGGNVERLISPPAFQFKGSGWYVTDYAGKSRKGKDSDKGAETVSKDTKSDSKPDKVKSADKPAPATTKT
jgi:putative FmdB family regulatory protein